MKLLNLALMTLFFVFANNVFAQGNPISYNDCINQGKSYFCHIPSNDFSKALPLCTGSSSLITGHWVDQIGNPPNKHYHKKHSEDFSIDNQQELELCRSYNQGSSSLHVCNVGIKHQLGNIGHIDPNSGELDSGPTYSTHDYATFNYINLNNYIPNRMVLEAVGDNNFNLPWDINDSFVQEISSLSFNKSSENFGTEYFVDYCYQSFGAKTESFTINFSLLDPSLIDARAEMYCDSNYPYNFTGKSDLLSGSPIFTFSSVPSACIVRLFVSEMTNEPRTFDGVDLFHLNEIRFVEE